VTRLAKAFRLLSVLWAGSLWSLIWVTQTLFHAQPDRTLAGLLAGYLFSIETYVGLATAACALCLPAPGRFRFGYIAAGVLAFNEWALRPVMRAARADGSYLGLSFGGWHGVSMLLYLVACIALLLLVWNEDLR
jgi:hypothetical protein